jgi:hypothetical protein
MFSSDLKSNAFRSANGEFGWRRSDIPEVIRTLVEREFAILGGEVWLVPRGARSWIGLIPQRDGTPAVYSWTIVRLTHEPWLDFVNRSAAESLEAVETMPDLGDLPAGFAEPLFYNLTWVSEHK